MVTDGTSDGRGLGKCSLGARAMAKFLVGILKQLPQLGKVFGFQYEVILIISVFTLLCVTFLCL